MHSMLLPESEGKRLLAGCRIPVPMSWKAATAEELAASDLVFPAALKADVASGGRGKAGGVRRCETMAEAVAVFHLIMQTRFGGEVPRGVLVEPWLTIAREIYLAVTVDGGAGGFVILYAPKGGIDVESGLPPTRYAFGVARNFRAHKLRRLLEKIEPDVRLRERVIALSRQLLRLASTQDCLTVEINPLVVLADGALLCGDAKIVRDEAAAYRSGAITAELDQAHARDTEQQKRCREARLTLVPLDGDIGLISSGAGMTMAVMDAIEAAGGHPACFLDCSGNPTPDGFSLAFDLLEQDARVRAILVSVFGGGMHTDRIARTLIDILARKASRKPVVFRLNGTGGARAAALLEAAGFDNHQSLEAAVASTLERARAA